MTVWLMVDLVGCDDHTLFAVEVETGAEVSGLLRLADLSQQVSSRGCMPRLTVERLAGPPAKPADECEDETPAFPLVEESAER